MYGFPHTGKETNILPSGQTSRDSNQQEEDQKVTLRCALWGHFTKDCFFPIGPIWTRLSLMNLFFFDRPDCRPESPRKSDRLLFLNLLKK